MFWVCEALSLVFAKLYACVVITSLAQGVSDRRMLILESDNRVIERSAARPPRAR